MSKSAKTKAKTKAPAAAAKTKTAAAEKKPMNDLVRLTVTLLVISAVCALLLGIVNAITAPRIAAAQEAKSKAAMAEVLSADSYEEVPFLTDGTIVLAVYRADDKGYVVSVAPSGFGGNIEMMVGVSNDGVCTGVSIVKMSETAGLGANASKVDFRAQFEGLSGTLAVTKDGGVIDALTGATITSRAVTSGVNAALEAVAALG